MSAAVETPGPACIGIDMARGPDVTAWRCGPCGAVGIDVLIGCARPDCPVTAVRVAAAEGRRRGEARESLAALRLRMAGLKHSWRRRARRFRARRRHG